MNQTKLVLKFGKARIPITIGNKADNLTRLKKCGFQIPLTYVITWNAYIRYQENDPFLEKDLRNELSLIIRDDVKYAVRSSANIEDRFDTSFAGQFKTFLNTSGVDEVISAIYSVWESAHTPDVGTYLERRGIEPGKLLMAILIQEMIQPVFSGVSFSRNPVTGSDETIIEAVKGLGTELVQSGVTPERWVKKWNYWLEKPTDSSLPADLLQQLIDGTIRISQKLGQQVDLEWVWDGKQLYWVQVREITTLDHRNIYSNYIPREMIPGMIKPLIFSINIPLINSVWINQINKITGDLGIKPEDLAKSFYFRVYFNMGKLGDIFESLGFPRESVEMMMGYLPKESTHMKFKPSLRTCAHIPRMVLFFFDKFTIGSRLHRALVELEKEVQTTVYGNIQDWSEHQLLDAIDKHYRLMQKVAEINVLGPILMGIYNRMLQGQLGKRGIDFTKFDLTEGMTDFQEYDPATHLRRMNKIFRSFEPGVQERIRNSSFAEIVMQKDLADFPGAITQFAERFGYLSDNGNDFSVTPWREKPDLVMELVVNFDPSGEEGEKKIRFHDLRTQRKAGPVMRHIYNEARSFRLLRERVSALYTYGYGLFRYYFLALGNHFVNRNLIEEQTDIYYLTLEEIRLIVSGDQQPLLKEKVKQHKNDMERYQDIVVPTIICGDEVPPIREASMGVLNGVPTSTGHYTGRVQVVRGIDDFNKVKKGDVLVVPYSDVGWTPLFARAGAVIAESGGLLSHSSIVAREYDIPAVVSVQGAIQLVDGILVTVDGHKGEIYIHPEKEQV